jgi:hypothetical protein
MWVARSSVMGKSKEGPSIIPGEDDQNVYLVVDDFGYIGRCWRETNVNSTDLETVITDLLDGQYNDPVRVVGFNTAEGWARDVSGEIAAEIRRRRDLQIADIPAGLEAFMDRHQSRGVDVESRGP